MAEWLADPQAAAAPRRADRPLPCRPRRHVPRSTLECTRQQPMPVSCWQRATSRSDQREERLHDAFIAAAIAGTLVTVTSRYRQCRRRELGPKRPWCHLMPWALGPNLAAGPDAAICRYSAAWRMRLDPNPPRRWPRTSHRRRRKRPVPAAYSVNWDAIAVRVRWKLRRSPARHTAGLVVHRRHPARQRWLGSAPPRAGRSRSVAEERAALAGHLALWPVWWPPRLTTAKEQSSQIRSDLELLRSLAHPGVASNPGRYAA